MSITKADRKSLRDAVRYEGFDEAFVNYSDFPEIVDADFHEKRKAYLAARAALGDLFEDDDS